MTEYRYTTADLMRELRLSRNTVRKRAAALGIGINREGRAGYLYSDADRQLLLDSLKPATPVAKRRKRRAA